LTIIHYMYSTTSIERVYLKKYIQCLFVVLMLFTMNDPSQMTSLIR